MEYCGSMQADFLKEFVGALLEKLGYTPTAIEVSTGHRTVVMVTTSDADALIGPNGDHLRALNTIARRMAEHQYKDQSTDFLIDINGHHEAQMEKVRTNARLLAQRTRLFKHDVEMEPMSSYERLVVHELFADDPEIETASAGEGKFRHIVLKSRGAGSPATA